MTPHREALLHELRPFAFAIAYRMLGSVTDAEDVVQEALIRVDRSLGDGRSIDSPRAFVATVTTRLAIDALRSSRSRRETYIGEWLPEPLVSDGGDDPLEQAELAESLSLAFLVLLERLSPEQRAAILLRDVFGYDYASIAKIIGKREANVRQLTARARQHVQAERPRFTTSSDRRQELARRFLAAARDGDLGGLETLLTDDVRLHGDGGGRAPALARSVGGRARVARTLIAWARQGLHVGQASVELVDVNGQPGALIRDQGGRVISVIALSIGAGQITEIHAVVNPDKLSHLGDVGSLRQLLERRRR